MSATTITLLAVYLILFGGGSLFLLVKTMTKKSNGATELGKGKDGFSSRIGYILSMMGVALGVGSLWRFPMMCAQWGGGAFVLAFVVVCIFVVIPAGWAEIAFSRYCRKGNVGCGAVAAGKVGKALGWVMSGVGIGVQSYYPIVMALTIIYFFRSLGGIGYAATAEETFEITNNSRMLLYVLTALIIIISAYVSAKGIQNGIEKVSKVILPLLFLVLIFVVVYVCKIPGIAEGIEYYIKPDWSQLANPEMWTAAASMALFAVGLGPGLLIIYGRYTEDEQDIATDFITVNVTQLFVCILAGFAIIPAVKVFGLDPLMGKGIMFVALPKVFATIPGGWFFLCLFFVALLCAGFSSTFALAEVSTCGMTDSEGFGWTKKKALIWTSIVTLVLAIPCVWSDKVFAAFDNIAGNIGYCVTALGLALILAWKVGARKIREEMYNPTSAIKWPPLVDFLYKYVAVFALAYFTVSGIATLFN